MPNSFWHSGIRAGGPAALLDRLTNLAMSGGRVPHGRIGALHGLRAVLPPIHAGIQPHEWLGVRAARFARMEPFPHRVLLAPCHPTVPRRRPVGGIPNWQRASWPGTARPPALAGSRTVREQLNGAPLATLQSPRLRGCGVDARIAAIPAERFAVPAARSVRPADERVPAGREPSAMTGSGSGWTTIWRSITGQRMNRSWTVRRSPPAGTGCGWSTTRWIGGWNCGWRSGDNKGSRLAALQPSAPAEPTASRPPSRRCPAPARRAHP